MVNKPLLANACPAREQPGDDEDDSNKADVDDDASELSRDDAAAAPPRSPLLALPRFGAAQQCWGASGSP